MQENTYKMTFYEKFLLNKKCLESSIHFQTNIFKTNFFKKMHFNFLNCRILLKAVSFESSHQELSKVVLNQKLQKVVLNKTCLELLITWNSSIKRQKKYL